MINDKLSPFLQLALRYEQLLNQETKEVFIENANENIWQLLMNYTGSLEELAQSEGLNYYQLNGGFAQILITKDEIGPLSDNPQVVYLSIPETYTYIDIGLTSVCASNLSGQFGGFDVTGAGVLLAVIDSGIDYSHPDFINEDGTTRIEVLWDQSLDGGEEGINTGQVFTRETINRALQAPDKAQQLAIVPSVDVLGHGTAVAGVAAGNGRGSAGRTNRGIAPGCDLIVVKLGRPGTIRPKDVSIMAGIDFSIERAKALGRPLVILLCVGNSLTGHNGSASLEEYITLRSNSWLCNFVVGTGNEADKNRHASGQIADRESQVIELLMDQAKQSYACCLWKYISDSMELVIESPSGEVTDALSRLTPNRAYLFNQTVVLINISEVTQSAEMQEIYILFQAEPGSTINTGIWRFTLRGLDVLRGAYNMWADILSNEEDRTRFLRADIDVTLTSPASAYRGTSVAAYNGTANQTTAFSGRGLTADNRLKPDLAAPGVNITVPSTVEGQLYQTMTGSSLATAFVAGAYVLLMEYGILQLGNVNLYGERLKVYLLRSARKLPAYAPYPNKILGYGTLCIEGALNLIKEESDKTS